MDAFGKTLKKYKKDKAEKPLLLRTSKKSDRDKLLKLLSSHAVNHVIDDYIEEQRELFAIKNPTIAQHSEFEKMLQEHLAKIEKKMPLSQHGVWVYFPWLSTVTHILDEEDFQLVRTARNRYLINHEEQQRFYHAVIGIAGLSVGSNVALAIVLQGGGKHLRLADHDRLALSNTNRIRAGVQNLGVLKVEMVARQIYEMNPYSIVEIMEDGLNPKNIVDFFGGSKGLKKLDIVIDEMDHLGMKYLIREHAQKRRLAVVMAADNGDSAVVDVERYDKNAKTPFFHGRLGKVSYESLSNLKKFEIGKMITKHVGPENVTERMRQSLLELGKTIVSWPQLGGAAMMSGASVAYCVRKILNDQPVIGNRAIVSLDEKLLPGYNSKAEVKRRAKTEQAFRKIFGL